MQKLFIIPALALLIAAPAAAEEVHLTADEESNGIRTNRKWLPSVMPLPPNRT